MIAQSCLHVRQAYTSWDMHVGTPWSYYLPMPHHVQSPRAVPYLVEELKKFKAALEEWTGKKITDADLKRGIEIVNRDRQLMKQVYELRKREQPPLSGLESMYMVVASQMTDKEEHARIVEDSLKELQNRTLGRPVGTRLMILGSEDDDHEFIEMVESCGSTFVIDDHCTGTRYFWDEVSLDGGDPLTAIATRYVNRMPCPTKDWPVRTRTQRILSMAKDWDAAGAVILQQKFCDPHELDIPAIKSALEEQGLTTLFLELDVTVPIGQFKTRVEAFLEILQEEDLF
jgi:benzoyl-CoA reductase subunit C